MILRCAILLVALLPTLAAGQTVEWTSNGSTPEGTRFSPAKQITTANVAGLRQAWVYRTGEADPAFETARGTSLEATPLVADGTMYVGTPLGRVIALDAATGEELWVFDPQVRRDIRYGDFASRGVSLWRDPAARPGQPCATTIFVVTPESELTALDARTGSLCRGFGNAGRVNLIEGLRIPPFEPAAYTVTSPPVVINDVVISGSSIGDNSRPDLPSGEVRGFHARTGALLWSWDPIPQDPADPAYGEWGGELGRGTGAANAWTVLAGDPARNLVLIPTGSAAPDYYGGLRLGDNRYANSIVALDATTGRRIWAFQTVHHDLWDYDNASPPIAATVRRGGVETPAVLQATKTGMLFVLDRRTGNPIFGVQERPVPPSRIPGEIISPTQPFTAEISPLSPHFLREEDIWGPTDEVAAVCREMIGGLRYDGIFTPPDTAGTLVFPSSIGGAHWGGGAWDESRQIVVIPVNRIAAEVQLIPRESIDLQEARRESARLGLGYEYNGMFGTPYIMRRRMLLGPAGLPCTAPPFGTLVAVSMETGARLWEVPVGSFERLVPPGTPLPAEWGSVTLGGPMITAGGLVFIAGSLDRSLKAFDIESGEELWRGALPESGKATPMSYQLADGRQYVAITVGGGAEFGEGDYVVTFALPSPDRDR